MNNLKVFYKVRDPKTNLYLTPGGHRPWNENGKTWSSLSNLRGQLGLMIKSGFRSDIEVIPFTCLENKAIDVFAALDKKNKEVDFLDKEKVYDVTI